jgi:hypothetical protein
MSEKWKLRIFAIVVIIVFMGAAYLMSKSDKNMESIIHHKYHFNH